MAAIWARNETDAAKRRVGMLIQKTDGSLAPRETDFMDLGYVKICGVSSPHFVLAVGTMTNQREPLLEPETLPEDWGEIQGVDDDADTMTMIGHGYQIGDGPVEFTAGTPPGGLSLDTPYWVVPADNNNFSLAESLADAYAGIIVDITDTTTGATLSIDADTQRGIDGHFVYEATQAETDHAAPETIVIVNGPSGSGYERGLGGGAYSTVAMSSSADDWGTVELEDGITRDDAMRAGLRTDAAEFREEVGGVITYRNMANTKDSHHGTITSTGRSDTGIDDLTP